MPKLIVCFLSAAMFMFAANNTAIADRMQRSNVMPIEAINLDQDVQCIYTGQSETPPWLFFNAPWDPNVVIPDVYNRNDQLLSMAIDMNGRIYVTYSTPYQGAGALVRYGWGLATSTDQGLTWDNRVYRVGSTNYSLFYPEITITDNGKIYLWGTIHQVAGGTAIVWCPAFMRSSATCYNNPDSLRGVSYFNIPNRIYPECISWGNGNEFILAQYTVDRAGTNDSMCVIWSGDSLATGTTYLFNIRPPLGNPEKTSVSVDVIGTDTILTHAIECLDATNGDWDVICYLDTINGSGNFYGWATGNTLNDRYPSVFANQGYTYIGYQADVGSGDNDIFFNYSTDYGQNWLGAMLDLTNDAANETYPRLNGIGSTIGFDYLYAGNSIRFNYSLDFGQEGTWLNTPEIVTDNSSASALYHSVALLHTSTYWYAAWEDIRNYSTDSTEIYTSRRVMGQGDITHRPSQLVFDYNLKAMSSAEKYMIHSRAGIDEKLNGVLVQSDPKEMIPVFIMMEKQLNPDYLIGHAEQMSKSERRIFVIDECQSLAAESQRGILDYLKARMQDGSAEDVKSLWSTNTVAFRATPAVIRELALRNDVWEIGCAERAELIDANRDATPTFREVRFIPENGREICWGVAKINADDVWVLGWTGAGIVVGHMDTGVNYNHFDLSDHLWDGGGTYPNHGYDFVNGDNDPMDDNGHGTATAGVVAGDGTSGSNTGVAPDAQIMILKCDGTNVEMQLAIQFGLTNGADLFSTSLGFANPGSTIKNWSRGQSNTIYAAGKVWCVAAGNGDGAGGHYSVPQDINSPADCPGPYYAPNGGNGAVMAAGATTISDNVDSYSSYGPTSWSTGTYTDYPYPPGLMKPDVAAPGSNVKSLDYALEDGYTTGWYGTSFAQPHLAGTVALMLSRNPALTPRQIDSLIQTTALDIETAGRDNYSGAGRINALLAVNSISIGSKWAQLWIINQATATGILQVTNITKQLNQPWLISYTPTAFSVPINDSVAVMVSVDTTGQGLTWGSTYYDTLLVWSNSILDDNPEKVPVIIIMGTIGVEENKPVAVGQGLIDLFIQPNPFRNSVNIGFTVLNSQNVCVTVYDVTGRKVRTLADQSYEPGRFSLAWDGSDNKGGALSSGVYFCRIETEGNQITNKLILTR